MAKVRDQFKRIDALFVNAGIGKFVPIAEVTEAMFDEIVTINLKGAFFTVQKALPLMARGSAVVLNASINAHIGLPGTTVYGATKAAVVNMAKTMSVDLAERGIRVNAVSPGPVETPIFSRAGISGGQSRQTKEWLQNQTLVKRMAEPEEIAEAVLYLSSDVSSFRRRHRARHRWWDDDLSLPVGACRTISWRRVGRGFLDLSNPPDGILHIKSV